MGTSGRHVASYRQPWRAGTQQDAMAHMAHIDLTVFIQDDGSALRDPKVGHITTLIGGTTKLHSGTRTAQFTGSHP